MIETHAQLYDLLQTYFGLGTYDDVLHDRDETEPWYKVRMTEIGKLKRLMNSRHVDVATVVAAAEFAHAQHRPVTAAWQVIELIPDARRAARETAPSLSEALQNATQQALAAGEQDWALRLAGASQRDALDAWEAHHG